MKTFRTRILVLLLALVVTTQLATMAALYVLTQREAQARAREELRAGGRVIDKLMHSRGEQLREAVQVLVADFGFKEAVTSGEEETVRSALENSAARLEADVAAFFDTEGHVLASTVPGLTDTVHFGSAKSADSRGRILPDDSDVLYRTVDGKPYLLVIAPVLAPAPVGWAAIGFKIDSRLAEQMRALLGVDVTYYDAERMDAAFVSTLKPQLQTELRNKLGLLPGVGEAPRRLKLAKEDYVLLVEAVDGSGGRLHVILQTSLADILAAFADLRAAILAIAALAVVLALPIASLLARGASRPLDQLVTAAHRIESGNYSVPVVLESSAEFGSVAATLNSMQGRIGEREQRIRHQATHDELTGLPNRVLFRERLESAMAAAHETGSTLALLLLDLREFEQINASFGHAFGDEVLKETARRLRGGVRTDATVARAGMSRFLVLLPGEDATRAQLLAGFLIESVRAGIVHDTVPISLDAHVGICIYPDHGEDPDSLLRRLDTSLYDARQSNTALLVYQPGRDEGHRRQLAIMGDLRRAISNSRLANSELANADSAGELELYYQPKVDMNTHQVRSLEALLRWRHPELGFIPPGEFIPLAESTGTIVLLTQWVLECVLRQMRNWQTQGFEPDVSVNLSAVDLLDPGLPDSILNHLKALQVPPQRLVLEITESAVMKESERAIRILERLRQHGIRFSIDDFGTGYSSLAQFKRLPVDEIKIDKSFVLGLTANSEDAVIVQSTIDLGHNLKVKVVAEGVENTESWRLLLKMGCDHAQGYFISKPLPAAKALTFVQELNSNLEFAHSATQQIHAFRLQAKTKEPI